MTLTIGDTSMTSDQTARTARPAPGGQPGLTAPEATARACQPPGGISRQQDQAGRQPDRQAAG